MIDLSIIIKPVVTEKSTSHNVQNKYVFEVKRAASKEQVRKAFKEIYKVKPVSLSSYITTSKVRMVKRGRVFEKRPVTKRMIITIAKGKTIDPNKIK